MRLGSDAASDARGRNLGWVAGCLLVVGLVARAAPFANRDGRLLREFPTEDGYLMLTIARNIALGRGMSTADGTIPTNGTQPLATYLWSACSFVVGGNKVGTVAVVQGVELLLATATAYAIYVLARRVLPDAPSSRDKAALAATGWYASATVVSHTMNCLESGLYVLLIVLVLILVFGSIARAPSPRLVRWAGIGALLGAAFWARNDAVLLCGTIAVVYLIWGLPGAPHRGFHRLTELVVAGAVCTCTAAPWLVFNYVRFGHVMPVSGQAESLDARFGGNAAQVGPSLVAYVTMFLPIPSALVTSPPFVAIAVVIIGAYAWVAWVWIRRAGSATMRQAWLLAATTTLAFGAFYGLFFGAQHFMSRYFLALSPLYAVAWGAAIYAGWSRLERASHMLTIVGALLLVALPVGLNLRTYRQGGQHPHFQVVEWLSSNVRDSEWVGAPQSGTAGYYHDRTINLDGKVNPAALHARRNGEVGQYVVDSDIQYVADWEGLAATPAERSAALSAVPARYVRLPDTVLTMADPVLAHAFDLVVDDKVRNLAVLKRKPR
jgi:hypothetical protein